MIKKTVQFTDREYLKMVKCLETDSGSRVFVTIGDNEDKNSDVLVSTTISYNTLDMTECVKQRNCNMFDQVLIKSLNILIQLVKTRNN